MINLEETAYLIHRTAKAKGFWDKEVDPDVVLAKLALVHSEVSEILEDYRKQTGPKAIAFEFADVLIRLLDLWQALKDAGVLSQNETLQTYIEEKMIQNAQRPVKHGNLI